jgi:tRNA A37 threonylcarbamoyladenosine dehydratase
VGQSKCAVMRERIVGINPSCHVQVIEDFLTAESAEGILSRGYDARERHWRRPCRPRPIVGETGLVGWGSGSNSILTSRSAGRGLLGLRYDMVLDAVDFADHKAELIAYCCANRLPVVSTGGTGGSDNPLAIKMDDITDVQHNKLLAATRKRLRKSKGFPAGVP